MPQTSLEAPTSRVLAPTALATLIALFSAALAVAEPGSVEEIDRCLQGNLPKKSTQLEVEFRSRDRAGTTTSLEAELFWKDFDGNARILLRLTDPPKYRGSALLIIQKDEEKRDMFMYLPELGRSKRITGRMMSGPVFGTDFSYEEFQRLEGMTAELDSKRLPDSTLDGTPVRVVEYRPNADAESAYDRIVQYVEAERCIALKVEFYDKGERLHKVLRADPASVRSAGGKWIAHRVTMRDELDGTETDLVINDVRFDESISRKMFSQRELEKGH